MKVIFHLFKMYLIVLSSNRVDLQFLGSKFCSFPAISLLFRKGGWPAGWLAGRRWLENSILRLTQPSLTGTGAELGNMHFKHSYNILRFQYVPKPPTSSPVTQNQNS